MVILTMIMTVYSIYFAVDRFARGKVIRGVAGWSVALTTLLLYKGLI